jgi:hypothetical protein
VVEDEELGTVIYVQKEKKVEQDEMGMQKLYGMNN